jgi:glycosyltransferase involved in cell wall biosynthesis
MGYSNSKTVRDFLYALKAAGIPFQSLDINTRHDVIASDYADILTPLTDFDIRKYDHVVEMFRSPLPDGMVPCRARIAFWEGEHGLLETFPYLRSPDPLIAMSDFNFSDFRNELPSETPVFKILYPLQRVSTDMDDRETTRARYGIDEDDFVAFFNFDLGSFFRKNPIGAMRAFAKAFRTEPKAKLVFKLNLAKNFPGRIDMLKAEASRLGISDKLILVAGYIPRKDVYGLANACDVYISLHRAEGFGIGVAEAMQLGKPVIVTDYSSTTEFCSAANSIPVPYRLVPIRSGEYFSAMQTWADADVDAAAMALRKCHDDVAFRTEIGRKGKAFVEEHFSTANFRKSVEAFLDATSLPH